MKFNIGDRCRAIESMGGTECYIPQGAVGEITGFDDSLYTFKSPNNLRGKEWWINEDKLELVEEITDKLLTEEVIETRIKTSVAYKVTNKRSLKELFRLLADEGLDFYDDYIDNMLEKKIKPAMKNESIVIYLERGNYLEWDKLSDIEDGWKLIHFNIPKKEKLWVVVYDNDLYYTHISIGCSGEGSVYLEGSIDKAYIFKNKKEAKVVAKHLDAEVVPYEG